MEGVAYEPRLIPVRGDTSVVVRLSSSTTNGIASFVRHCSNITSRPTRLLPSWNRWMRSNRTRQSTMSSNRIGSASAEISFSIAASTSAGGVVMQPASFGALLQPLITNQAPVPADILS